MDRDAIADAVAAQILTAEEALVLRAADEATDRAIRVDDFDPDELASRQVERTPRIGTAAE
jgi:acyl-CoA dehydrogenase